MPGCLHFRILLVLVVLMVASATSPASEQAETWLEDAVAHSQQVIVGDEEDPARFVYEKADLLSLATFSHARLGQKEQTLIRAQELAGVVVLIRVIEGDGWANCYLPAAFTAAGLKRNADAVMATAEDPWLLADAHQMLCEYHLAMGDEAEAKKHLARGIALLGRAERKGLADAAADPAWEFDGTYTAWYFARAMRDFRDLEGVRMLAAHPFVDAAERAGVLAVASQMEFTSGQQGKARALLDRGVAAHRQAIAQMEANPDRYMADFETHLPELVAAHWLITGEEAARKFAGHAAHEGLAWEAAAMVHTAVALRRLGRVEEAEKLARRAVDVLDFSDLPPTWDTYHVARELTYLGLHKDAEKLIEGLTTPLLRAFAALGVAHAHIWPDAQPGPAAAE